MPPDTEVIETRLAMLAERLTDLKALQETTFDEYQQNRILNVLQEHLVDFEQFATAISDLISEN